MLDTKGESVIAVVTTSVVGTTMADIPTTDSGPPPTSTTADTTSLLPPHGCSSTLSSSTAPPAPPHKHWEPSLAARETMSSTNATTSLGSSVSTVGTSTLTPFTAVAAVPPSGLITTSESSESPPVSVLTKKFESSVRISPRTERVSTTCLNPASFSEGEESCVKDSLSQPLLNSNTFPHCQSMFYIPAILCNHCCVHGRSSSSSRCPQQQQGLCLTKQPRSSSSSSSAQPLPGAASGAQCASDAAGAKHSLHVTPITLTQVAECCGQHNGGDPKNSKSDVLSFISEGAPAVDDCNLFLKDNSVGTSTSKCSSLCVTTNIASKCDLPTTTISQRACVSVSTQTDVIIEPARIIPLAEFETSALGSLESTTAITSQSIFKNTLIGGLKKEPEMNGYDRNLSHSFNHKKDKFSSERPSDITKEMNGCKATLESIKKSLMHDTFKQDVKLRQMVYSRPTDKLPIESSSTSKNQPHSSSAVATSTYGCTAATSSTAAVASAAAGASDTTAPAVQKTPTLLQHLQCHMPQSPTLSHRGPLPLSLPPAAPSSGSADTSSSSSAGRYQSAAVDVRHRDAVTGSDCGKMNDYTSSSSSHLRSSSSTASSSKKIASVGSSNAASLSSYSRMRENRLLFDSLTRKFAPRQQHSSPKSSASKAAGHQYRPSCSSSSSQGTSSSSKTELPQRSASAVPPSPHQHPALLHRPLDTNTFPPKSKQLSGGKGLCSDPPRRVSGGPGATTTASRGMSSSMSSAFDPPHHQRGRSVGAVTEKLALATTKRARSTEDIGYLASDDPASHRYSAASESAPEGGDPPLQEEGEEMTPSAAAVFGVEPESVSPSRLDDWIHLNVGGEEFTTSRATLILEEPESMLAKMFGGQHPRMPPASLDRAGRYVIDRSPRYFGPLLNYLRTGVLVLDPGLNPEGVLQEARFYGLEGVIPRLEALVTDEAQQPSDKPLTRQDVVRALLTTAPSTALRFQAVNLRGADLSWLDLRFINFKYADLRNANLTGANLSSCNLERAKLSNACLEQAQLLNVRLVCADLQDTNMRGCNFENPSGGTLPNCEGVNLRNSNLEGSMMAHVNLRVSTLKNANLRNCDLRMSVLAGADLENCDLSGSNLLNANLRGANLKDASFELMQTPLHMSQTCDL